jgi:2-octaprenyl-6-methoxyphenol hydroxylase
MNAIPRFAHYDVVIVGAGMVGSTLSCALTQQGLPPRFKLLLVEASPIDVQQEPRQPGYDMRSTVLSAGTAACFAHLGLWEDCSTTAEPILDIHVSDQGRIGSVRLNSREERVAALGYVVENAALGRTLNRRLVERELELCAPASVQLLQPCEQGMRLSLSTAAGEQTLTASLVVLADGGRSGLCRQVGIDHREQQYGQTAIIANVSFSKAHHGVAYERFTAKGPLALLPLPDHQGEHRAALVWTHPEEVAGSVLTLTDREFLARLQEDFGTRLGQFTRVGKRAAYPLGLQLADEQVRPGLVLLGNAAHSLHPVAGQGFNLALRDTMLLAHNILQSLEGDCSPGSAPRLHAYLEAASLDQTLTIGFSDYMTRLFSTNNRPLAWARQWGMACVDILPPLKHGLSRQAMGMAHKRVLP